MSDAFDQSPFLTLKQAAKYFCVDETSIRRSRGIFARLRRTTLNNRTLIYRESAEALKAELDERAYIVADHGLVKKQKVA